MIKDYQPTQPSSVSLELFPMEFGSIADIAFAEKTSNAARTSKCVKFHDPGLPIGN